MGWGVPTWGINALPLTAGHCQHLAALTALGQRANTVTTRESAGNEWEPPPRPAKSWKGCCRWSGPLGRAFGQPPVVPALRSGGCLPLCRCWELGRGSAPGGIEGREGSIPACEEAGITDLTAVGPKAPALPQPRPGVPPSQAQHQGPCPLPLPQGCDGATHLQPCLPTPGTSHTCPGLAGDSLCFPRLRNGWSEAHFFVWFWHQDQAGLIK